MHETTIYFESTSGLVIVHFDFESYRQTHHYNSTNADEMALMGRDLKNFHLLDCAAPNA